MLAWKTFKQAIAASSVNTISIKEARKIQKWITEKILGLLSERRQAKLTNTSEYNNIDKLIKVKCIQEKEKWLTNKCAEMETKKNTDSLKMHNNIHEIIGGYRCTLSECIKSKSGVIIMGKVQEHERWTEYIKDLFADDRQEEKQKSTRNMQGPQILKVEVRRVVNHIKK